MTNNSGWREKLKKLRRDYLFGNREKYDVSYDELIDEFIAEAIEEARKEGARELGAYNLTCPYLPGNPNQNKLCDAWHRGVQDRQALIETALKEMSGEKE